MSLIERAAASKRSRESDASGSTTLSNFRCRSYSESGVPAKRVEPTPYWRRSLSSSSEPCFDFSKAFGLLSIAAPSLPVDRVHPDLPYVTQPQQRPAQRGADDAPRRIAATTLIASPRDALATRISGEAASPTPPDCPRR